MAEVRSPRRNTVPDGRVLVRVALEGAGAAVAAVAVMAGLCAFGLAQLGAEGVPAMTAAAVTLAVGGSVDLTVGGSGRAAELGAGLHGTAHLVPLGVSLAGAAVLVLAFWAPVRRRAAAELWTRAFGAAAAFLVAMAVLALLGRGRLPLGDLGMRPDRAEDGPSRPGAELPPGLAERLADRPGAGGVSRDAWFGADLLAAVGAGLVWVLVVLAVGWLGSGRAPLPTGWTWAHRLRPVVSSTAVVLLVPVCLATAAGLVLGLVGRNGAVAGGVLFGGATAVLVALALGIGVPWSVSTGGAMTDLLPPDRLPDAVLGLDAGRWPVLPAVAFAVVALLVSAVLAARHEPSGGDGSRLRGAVDAGLWHGLVVAVSLALLTLLAGSSVEFGVSVLGSELVGTELGLGGNVLLTLAVGSVAGAVTGAAGYLAVDLTRRARRPRSPSTVDT